MLNTLTRMGAAAVATAALLAPGAASAQTYSYQGYNQNYGTGAYGRSYDYSQGSYYSRDDGRYADRYYDACERQRDGTVAGGVVGATIGAIAGSQIAARGHRTDGSIVGGLLGAAVGASAGRGDGGACDSRYSTRYRYGDQGYDSRYGSSAAYDRRYDDGYGYDPRYNDDRYDRRYDDRYQSGAYSYQSNSGSDDGCRLAESQVRLPDGRYESRYVRTCPDQYGRYRVVD